MTTETQSPDPAPAKPFFAYDPENGVEWFETMQEAQAYAAESLREYRRSASFDGEWSGDVEAVKVGRVTHIVAEHGDDESGYDYRLVSAIPAPEGALRAAANAVLTRWNSPLWRQDVGTAELMAKLRAALAAPAPQAAVALTDEQIRALRPLPFSNAELDRLYANIPPTAQQDARSREAFKRIARIVEDGHDIRSYQTKEPTNDR